MSLQYDWPSMSCTRSLNSEVVPSALLIARVSKGSGGSSPGLERVRAPSVVEEPGKAEVARVVLHAVPTQSTATRARSLAGYETYRWSCRQSQQPGVLTEWGGIGCRCI